MKILVIYYSLTGNAKLVAEIIAEKTGADLLGLKPEKELNSNSLLKHLWGGKQVITKEKPKLLPLAKNPKDYDLIFIGTPVWAFNFCPAVRSFLAENKITDKKIVIFCCHEGMMGKTFQNLKKELANNEIIGQLDLILPIKNKDKAEQKIQDWLKTIIQ